MYVEYVDGEHEYYDIAKDPFELRNVYADLRPARRALLHRQVAQFVRCHGAVACHRADQLLPPSSKPREHVDDVAADHAEVVAALLDEQRRAAGARDAAPMRR